MERPLPGLIAFPESDQVQLVDTLHGSKYSDTILITAIELISNDKSEGYKPCLSHSTYLYWFNSAALVLK